MTEELKPKCCAGTVWQRHYNYKCGSLGKHLEDSKWWCGVHLPSRVKARHEKNTAKMHWVIKGEGLRDEISYQSRIVTTVARDVVNGLFTMAKLVKAVRDLEATEKKMELHKSTEGSK